MEQHRRDSVTTTKTINDGIARRRICGAAALMGDAADYQHPRTPNQLATICVAKEIVVLSAHAAAIDCHFAIVKACSSYHRRRLTHRAAENILSNSSRFVRSVLTTDTISTKLTAAAAPCQHGSALMFTRGTGEYYYTRFPPVSLKVAMALATEFTDAIIPSNSGRFKDAHLTFPPEMSAACTAICSCYHPDRADPQTD